jgi:hypothetical protein
MFIINTVTPSGSKINNPVMNAVRIERNIIVVQGVRILQQLTIEIILFIIFLIRSTLIVSRLQAH